MPPTKVFVGNLPDNCNPDRLRELFLHYGEITELVVIKNYAFIHFTNEEDASNAVRGLNRSNAFEGRMLTVEISNNRRSREGRHNDWYNDRHNDDRHARRGDRGQMGGVTRGRSSSNVQPLTGTGGILGNAPIDQSILGNFGIFSAVKTLAAAAAVEQQNRQVNEKIDNQETPDPEVRVRREVVHCRDVPNSSKLGLSDGYVIHERYYVDPSHPLLKGLPLPNLPRISDKFTSLRDLPPPRADNGYVRREGYTEFRDRSPVNLPSAHRLDIDRERENRSHGDFVSYYGRD